MGLISTNVFVFYSNNLYQLHLQQIYLFIHLNLFILLSRSGFNPRNAEQEHTVFSLDLQSVAEN